MNVDVATEGEPGEPTEAQPIVIPEVAGNTATYAITIPGLPGVSFDAELSVTDGTFRFELNNLTDPADDVLRVRIPNHNLVTVGSADPAAQLTAGLMGVDRNINDDRYERIAATNAGSVQGSWMVFANDSNLAAAFDTNAIEDNRGPASTSGRVSNDNSRYQRQITLQSDGVTKHGSVWAGTWTWLGAQVKNYDGQSKLDGEAYEVIGREDNPFVEVKLTADRNDDGLVDWQDAGIAMREIVDYGHGAEDVKNEVISRIPFNIVSQATHPFLRTLDDTKRISLATDNLGQKALLKGYQAEGHDSAHRTTQATTTSVPVVLRTSRSSPTKASSSTPATACT